MMKCIVIYFSLSGNTKKVAEAICAGIGQAAGSCDILPIKETDPKGLGGYDLIGFGTPVMGWMPLNVEAFLRRVSGVEGKHAFSFCTHNTYWDEYFPAVIPAIENTGLKVIGWDHWFGSAYGPLSQPTPYLTDGHPDKADLAAAEAFGREMVSRSLRIRAGEEGLIPPVPEMPSFEVGREGLPPPPSKEELREQYKNAHKLFTYDASKCSYPACTICMDNCPMGGIDLSVDPPRIARPCMKCQFCDQFCPTGAISFSREEIEAQVRMDREVNFMAAAVERCREYEQLGRFTRYVPEDRVGWDRYIYEVYDQRPRFVIGKGRVQGIDPSDWNKESES